MFFLRDSAFSRNAFTRNCKLYVKQKSKLQTIKHFESNSIVLDAFYGFNVWKNKTNCLHIILSGFVCIFCALFLRCFFIRSSWVCVQSSVIFWASGVKGQRAIEFFKKGIKKTASGLTIISFSNRVNPLNELTLRKQSEQRIVQISNCSYSGSICFVCMCWYMHAAYYSHLGF